MYIYESFNLDRGGSNRRKIEELSRSSREKLLQSKNKMFSKFTSILQHAVEAVRKPATEGKEAPSHGCGVRRDRGRMGLPSRRCYAAGSPANCP